MHYSAWKKSISLQREDFCLNAVFGDELDLHAIAGVDVPLGGDDEDVLHDAHHFVRGERLLLVLSVLVADQVVENGHDEVLAGAHTSVVIALEGTHGVVSIHCSFAYMQMEVR